MRKEKKSKAEVETDDTVTRARPQRDVNDPAYAASFDARTAYWSAIGSIDEDVLSYIISPGHLGGSQWPTTRQAFRIVRTADSVILASDGLSDPFQDQPGWNAQGFGMEVFVEIPGSRSASQDAIMRLPAFDLLRGAAALTADRGGLMHLLDVHGFLSTEFGAPDGLPEGWATAEQGPGALIGMTAPERPKHVAEMPFEDRRVVAVTAIRADELARAAASEAGCTKLAQQMKVDGPGHLTDFNRASVGA